MFTFPDYLVCCNYNNSNLHLAVKVKHFCSNSFSFMLFFVFANSSPKLEKTY